MSQTADVIVIGSGASAVHAARPLVESGRRVIMLDVGREDRTYEPLIPEEPFAEIRRGDTEQHRYFLGDHFESVSADALGAGPQVTPPRRFVLRETDPAALRADHFAALESWAQGGLAGVWGAVSFPFTERELEKCALPPATLAEYYEAVARIIGVAGCDEDLRGVSGKLDAALPPAEMDNRAEAILARYRKNREGLRRAGFSLGRPFLAMLTRPLGGRSAQAYHDMDFWSNAGGSVYRPAITLGELKADPHFSYRYPYEVHSFAEDAQGKVSVTASAPGSKTDESFEARALILAAGTLGTARIVLRSLNQYDTRVPLTSNPHSYVPCLVGPSLGQRPRERCHSLAQLTLIYNPEKNGERLVQAQYYSYRSLLLFRLLKESRLPGREALRILRDLSHALGVWVIQHEDVQGAGKYCVLRKDKKTGGDLLEIVYEPDAAGERTRRQNEKALIGAMRQMGCWPLKLVHPGHGASAHYASTFPAGETDRPLTTDGTGRLRGTRSVYLADGSSFNYLPAKALTLTLMANARRIGTALSAIIGTP